MQHLKRDDIKILKALVMDAEKSGVTVYEQRENRGRFNRYLRLGLLKREEDGKRHPYYPTPFCGALSAAELGDFQRVYVHKKGGYTHFSSVGTITAGSFLAPDLNSINVGSV